MRLNQTRGLTGMVVMALLLAGGCAKMAKHFADKEVYEIIEDSPLAGMPDNFSIDETTHTLALEIMTADAPTTLTLAQAVAVAVHNSRDYQSQKESLFAQALTLTLARHEWSFLFSGTGNASVTRVYEREVKLDPDGNPIVDRESGEARTRQIRSEALAAALSIGIRKMLVTGADLSASIVTDVSRLIHKDDPEAAMTSVFRANVVQPLLQGAWPTVALEGIRQAERNMVYAIRSFVKYRRSFSINIAKQYYALIQAQDQLVNQRNSYESRVLDLKRVQAYFKGGREDQLEVARVEQSVLSARDAWQSAVQQYENSLDEFKVTLGLPTATKIAIDSSEKQALESRETRRVEAPDDQTSDTLEIVSVDFDLDTAIEIALRNRLDLKTVINRTEDAERKVKVAKNGLLMKVDVSAGYSNQTPDPDRPYRFEKENGVETYGLDFELPLDKKADRNVYRQSLIDMVSARRDEEEQTDRVILEVRNAFRRLEQERNSYEIQLLSLFLAKEKVRSTEMLFDAGRMKTRDAVEAKDELLLAQNGVVEALISHNNAKLDLYLAMEVLQIDESGWWTVDLNAGELKSEASDESALEAAPDVTDMAAMGSEDAKPSETVGQRPVGEEKGERTVGLARDRYESAQIKMELAQRRVSDMERLVAAGRVQSVELLDAQKDLLTAQVERGQAKLELEYAMEATKQ